MTARRLGVCPTCRRPLDDHTRSSMGLRNGELLNALCPGRIGPSDIDHVLHNGHSTPELIYFLEYKDGAEMPRGQRRLFDALRGDWQSRTGDGRLLSIRYQVLQQHDSDAEWKLRGITEFLWPPQGEIGWVA